MGALVLAEPFFVPIGLREALKTDGGARTFGLL